MIKASWVSTRHIKEFCANLKTTITFFEKKKFVWLIVVVAEAAWSHWNQVIPSARRVCNSGIGIVFVAWVESLRYRMCESSLVAFSLFRVCMHMFLLLSSPFLLAMGIRRVWLRYAHTYILSNSFVIQIMPNTVFDIYTGYYPYGYYPHGSTYIDCYPWVSMGLYIFHPILITTSKE